MNLRPLGPNQTEIQAGRYEILFSYRTPVAYRNTESGKWYKTSKFWSRTTTRHINKWLREGPSDVEECDQQILDRLLSDTQYEEVNHA